MSSLEDTRMDPAQDGSKEPTDPNRELQRIGQFRLLRRLGEGGMGVVYLAYHPKLKTHIALKILAEQYCDNQNFIDRFYREAKSGALLNHPNIVRSYGAGQDKSTARHYLVLEYVDGPSAMKLLREKGRLSVGDTVRVTYDIACALEHAHSRNVIHRDIKPDNILITKAGTSKLTDLGLAKRTDEVSHLTAARQSFGTPHYMPYEQAVNARKADHRSDIYALGATAYHLVTGALPFPGESPLDVVEKKEIGDLIPASSLSQDVPHVLDCILAKMMARQPRDRYQTVSELIVDLERADLAAPILSFVDPDLAMQDPEVRARAKASQAESTQPDLAQVLAREKVDRATKVSPAHNGIVQVRFQVQPGTWKKLNLTMTQLEKRMRMKRIPLTAEVCSNRREGFVPLKEHHALRELVRAMEQHKSTSEEATDAKSEPISEEKSEPPPPTLAKAAVILNKLSTGLIVLSTIVSLAALSILLWKIA